MHAQGFSVDDPGYLPPAEDGSKLKVIMKPDSQRLQLLEPFKPWEGVDLKGLRVLIKKAKKNAPLIIYPCWTLVKFRGHLDNISIIC